MYNYVLIYSSSDKEYEVSSDRQLTVNELLNKIGSKYGDEDKSMFINASGELRVKIAPINSPDDKLAPSALIPGSTNEEILLVATEEKAGNTTVKVVQDDRISFFNTEKISSVHITGVATSANKEDDDQNNKLIVGEGASNFADNSLLMVVEDNGISSSFDILHTKVFIREDKNKPYEECDIESLI